MMCIILHLLSPFFFLVFCLDKACALMKIQNCYENSMYLLIILALRTWNSVFSPYITTFDIILILLVGTSYHLRKKDNLKLIGTITIINKYVFQRKIVISPELPWKQISLFRKNQKWFAFNKYSKRINNIQTLTNI